MQNVFYQIHNLDACIALSEYILTLMAGLEASG